MMKKKINATQKQRAVARRTTRIRSFEAKSAVTQQETSVGIRSSELVNSEVLQEMLEDKHRGSGWYAASEPKVRSSVLH